MKREKKASSDEKKAVYENPRLEVAQFKTEDVIFESDNYVPWNNPNPSI